MSNPLIRQTDFVSFDGMVSVRTEHQRPDRYRHLETLEKSALRIARGGGYSYSAASFGANTVVQEMTRFNRFLAFDSKNLTVKVEPGVTLLDLLNWASKRQLYFPIISGYPFITIGGSLAGDVHGKNPHRDGTFSDWVKELTLFHPDKGYLVASPKVAPDIFSLTCGGFGLTGIITEITLQLMPLPADHVNMQAHNVRSLVEAVELISNSTADFAYSWHDGVPGGSFGRGTVYSGRWGQDNAPITEAFSAPQMTSESRRKLPLSLWNGLTGRVVNRVFLLKNHFSSHATRKDLLQATSPFASNTLYHRFFGRPGLREAQVLIPDERFSSFAGSLERLVQTTKPPSLMMSIKRFTGRQQSLSMTGSGYLVAIDCYQNSQTLEFLRRLDELMVAEKGQPNLTKDSRISKQMAEATIKNHRSFRERLNRYDPARVFRSKLSDGIGL